MCGKSCLLCCPQQVVVEVEGGLEGCPVRGVLEPSSLQLFAVLFHCPDFLDVPSGHFGGFSLDVALERDDSVCGICDPCIKVFHSLCEVGVGSKLGGVEGICTSGLRDFVLPPVGGVGHLGGDGAGAGDAEVDDGVSGPCEFYDVAVFDTVAEGENWV